ncbi:MAG: SpoIIE family protein phosphatase, partial [Flammeovirgaceae bacterium]|nr:SpoIIE family protein phosphatase [Flammeovirgaceae bacterium]MDW8287746.1 SpoIIE family protein phosphatase [Flammeovirgaceae bacterium]
QYAILQRDKELQAAKLREQLSEKQRIEQLLELTQQKAENEKQTQEVERQRLIAEKERAEKERTEKELSLSQEQQRLQEATIKQKNQIQYLLYAIATVILLALIFVFRSLRITKKLNKQLSFKNKKIAEQNLALKEKQEEINAQNEELQQQAEEIMAQRDALATLNSELDKKNRDIMASIHYASRIQKGILPMDEELKKWFSDCFILFKPRDVVSGDFYWFAKDKDMCVVAACDCTGHGVPGSLMSMIASSALSKSFHEKSLRRPELLLRQANIEIIQSLDQVSNKSSDGMDAALCAYYPHENKIIFAGAKNGVVYIKNEQADYIKGDNHPVGDYNYGMEREYTPYEIPVENGLCVYIFSDGYGDQFGGKKGKKYGKKQLQETFQQIHALPCHEQREKLDQIHINWMAEANEKQIDDVLVIGLKIIPKN